MTAIAIRGDIESINVSISVDNDYFEGIGSEVKPPSITTAPPTPKKGQRLRHHSPKLLLQRQRQRQPYHRLLYWNLPMSDPYIIVTMVIGTKYDYPCVNEDYIFRRTSSDHPLVVVKTADCVDVRLDHIIAFQTNCSVSKKF